MTAEMNRAKRAQGHTQEAESMASGDAGQRGWRGENHQEKVLDFWLECFPTEIHNRAGEVIRRERKMRF